MDGIEGRLHRAQHPRSNNDLVPWTNVTPAQAAQQQPEFQGRLSTDLAWLHQAFYTASANRAQGIVLMVQADMWDPGEPSLSGYDVFLQHLKGLARSFGKPVLILEGDSHVFRVDHPLTPSDPLYSLYPLGGASAPNVRRLVVEGSTNPTEYLRLIIDPKGQQLLSWVRVPL